MHSYSFTRCDKIISPPHPTAIRCHVDRRTVERRASELCSSCAARYASLIWPTGVVVLPLAVEALESTLAAPQAQYASPALLKTKSLIVVNPACITCAASVTTPSALMRMRLKVLARVFEQWIYPFMILIPLTPGDDGSDEGFVDESLMVISYSPVFDVELPDRSKLTIRDQYYTKLRVKVARL
jgi:hypothetical protein